MTIYKRTQIQRTQPAQNTIMPIEKVSVRIHFQQEYILSPAGYFFTTQFFPLVIITQNSINMPINTFGFTPIAVPLLHALQRLHHINMIQYTVCNQIYDNRETKGQ